MSAIKESSPGPNELHIRTLNFYMTEMRQNERFKLEIQAKMSVRWLAMPEEERIMRRAIGALLHPQDPEAKARAAQANLLYLVILDDIAAYDNAQDHFNDVQGPEAPVA